MKQFEEIFTRYSGDVHRFLLKLCGYDEQLALELTQETFYRAYLSLDRFEGRCTIKTWLIRIFRNCFYQVLRKKRRHEIPIEEISANLTADHGLSVEDAFFQLELLSRAWTIIDAAPAVMRDVMLYRIYSDLTYAEIAADLSISESSAKVLFYRGKHFLRTKLKEVYGYEL